MDSGTSLPLQQRRWSPAARRAAPERRMDAPAHSGFLPQSVVLASPPLRGRRVRRVTAVGSSFPATLFHEQHTLRRFSFLESCSRGHLETFPIHDLKLRKVSTAELLAWPGPGLRCCCCCSDERCDLRPCSDPPPRPARPGRHLSAGLRDRRAGEGRGSPNAVAGARRFSRFMIYSSEILMELRLWRSSDKCPPRISRFHVAIT